MLQLVIFIIYFEIIIKSLMLVVFETWKLNEYLYYDFMNIIKQVSKLSLSFLLPDNNTMS